MVYESLPGVVVNEGAFVDMAAGIGICGTMRDVFLLGPEAGIASLPTLAFVAIGAFAGITAVAIEKCGKKRIFQASKLVLFYKEIFV